MLDDIRLYCIAGVVKLSWFQILKKKEVDRAINELEEIVEEFDLSEKDWSSVDDASDYLFEHKITDEEE